MERNGRERAELAEHIKSHRRRKHVCVSLNCSPATGSDGAACTLSTAVGKQGREDGRDRRGHPEKPAGRSRGGEKKPTAGGN